MGTKTYSIGNREFYAGGKEFEVAYASASAWSPTDIAGCGLWLDAEQGVTKDGSNYVSVWADQSLNGKDATQSTGDYQPLWVDAILNGKPVLRFDGSDDYLTIGTQLGKPLEYSIFVVFKSTIVTFPPNYICGAQNAAEEGRTTWGTIITGYNFIGDLVTYYGDDIVRGAAHCSNETISPSQYYYVSTIKTDSVLGEPIWVNGVSQTTYIVGTATQSIGDAYEFTIGDSGGSHLYNLTGDIAEIVIYNVAISETDRLAVETYLDNKYKITNRPLLWLSADSGITKDESDYVSGWIDQSGNGFNASQGTGTNQPLWVDNQLNGKPIIRFDGNDNYLTLGTQLGRTANYTTFIVFMSNNTTAWKYLCGADNAGGNGYAAWNMFMPGNYTGDGQLVSWYGSDDDGTSCGTSTPTSTFSGNTYYYMSTIHIDKVLGQTFWLNGVSAATTSVLGGVSSTGLFYEFAIGRGGAYDGLYFSGDIAEIKIYDFVLTDAQRQAEELRLKNKYGL